MFDLVLKQAYRYRLALLFGVMCALIYFPIFLHLDSLTLRMWDESIMGIEVVEMRYTHNYIVTYFFDQPDLSNCKPPLMIWMAVLFSNIWGFSELTLRLPSAIAAVILCLYLFFTLRKHTGSAVYAFSVVMVLITSQGYVRNHVIRTGEYDSILTLFTTIFSLHLFYAVTQSEKQSRNIFLFFVFLTLAVLTKGIACMMFAPGLLIYVLYKKKLLFFLKNKYTYLGLLFFIVFGLGYYFLRETMNPGYLQAVWVNELGGRFNGSLDGHNGPFTFYLYEIVTWQFVPYLLIFPVALWLGLKLSKPEFRDLILFAFINALFYLLVISKAATKLPHYDAPMFPFLAIITAFFFYFVYKAISEKVVLPASYVSSFLGVAVVFMFFYMPYSQIISKVYFPKGDYWEDGFTTSCRYFQMAVRGQLKHDNPKLLFNSPGTYGVGATLRCYGQIMKEKGLKASFAENGDIAVGDSVLIFDGWNKSQLSEKFVLKDLQRYEKCDAELVYVESQKTSI